MSRGTITDNRHRAIRSVVGGIGTFPQQPFSWLIFEPVALTAHRETVGFEHDLLCEIYHKVIAIAIKIQSGPCDGN